MTNTRTYVNFMLSQGIEGLRITTEKPVTWGNGIKSPIDVNNWMALASFKIRDMIYDDIAKIIKNKNITCDALLAASTAGLHIGPSVAAKLGVPFVLIKDGKAFEVLPAPINYDHEGITIIVASNPDAIPLGISLANKEQLPFAYVRQSQKNHGLENYIEGYAGQVGNALLLDYYFDQSCAYHARQIIQTHAPALVIQEMKSSAIPATLEAYDLQNKHCVVLEDQFGPSESIITQVMAAHHLGAIIEHVVGIFDYELQESNDRIKNVNVQKHAFITVMDFLGIAFVSQPILKEQWPEIGRFLTNPKDWKIKKSNINYTKSLKNQENEFNV